MSTNKLITTFFFTDCKRYQDTNACVRVLVGDNCATNQAIASRLQIPLVGCASHRFNLAVSAMIAEYQDVIDEVQAIMTQLRQPNNFAELQTYTDLKPVRSNVTRWSSTFKMLSRYVQLRDAIKMISAVEDLVPRPTVHRQIVQLLGKLKDLDSVCVRLQSEDCSMADARVLFDAVMAKYPQTASYLKMNARIVHAPTFENAVVKLQRNQPLCAAEEVALKSFKIPSDSPAAERDAANDLGFRAVEALREAKKPRTTSKVKYMELLRMIPPTSNRVERLFSQAKLVLTPIRSRLLPANFEMIMFLRVNRDLWGYGTVLAAESE